jgi:hypothetical protein
MRLNRLFVTSVFTILSASGLRGQDANIVYPVKVVEQRMMRDTFRIIDVRGSRRVGDRTQRVTIAFPDSMVMITKWGASARDGEVFNNSPRYEVAAYDIQKLFLAEDDYVVPPTILRAFDVDYFHAVSDIAGPTFSKTRTVLAVLQYWLSAVSGDSVFDMKRFDRDTAYARNLGNLNLLTYIIRHNDANAGNVLISTVSINPRLFSVDNGVAFGYAESDRGTDWRDLRVSRVPAYTVEKLRKITREDLERTLGVVAEYEIKGDALVPVEPGENMDRGRGVRKKENRVQFGLTKLELDGVESRIKNIVKRVDDGKLKTF